MSGLTGLMWMGYSKSCTKKLRNFRKNLNKFPVRVRFGTYRVWPARAASNYPKTSELASRTKSGTCFSCWSTLPDIFLSIRSRR